MYTNDLKTKRALIYIHTNGKGWYLRHTEKERERERERECVRGWVKERERERVHS
jgi:hypothetical protein